MGHLLFLLDYFCHNHLRRVMILCFMLSSFSLKAQNTISSYYSKCLRNQYNLAVLQMADTLRAMAPGSDLWYCRSIQLKLDYYYGHDDERNMLKMFQQLSNAALEGTEKQSIFYGWNRVVAYYINHHDYPTVENELKLMFEEANRQKNDYGISRYHILSAVSYLQRNLHQRAIEELELCIRKIKSSNMKVDLSYPYSLLGSGYVNVGNNDKAIECFQQSLNYSTPSQRVIPMIYLLNLYASEGKTKEIEQYKDELLSDKVANLLTPNALSMLSQGMTHYYISKNMPDSALYYLNRIPSVESKAEVAAKYYEWQGNYKAAYDNFDFFTSRRDSLRRHDAEQQLTIFLSRLEEQDLQSGRNIMKQKELQLLAEREERENELLLLESNERELRIQNQEIRNQHQLQKQQLQEVSQRQLQLRNEAQWREDHARQQRYMIAIIGMAIFTVLLIVYLIWRFINTRKLRKEKLLAEEATRKAQQTNLMKSMFLQNMNHEIRAPLSAIVGFSSLLNKTEEYGITPEERLTMMRDIQSNTDLLLTLIDDIIDLTTLQSGAYQLESTVFSLTELCRTALSSIRSNVPDGVELILSVPKEDRLVKSDHKRLLQVLLNLLGNACKYTQNGSITLGYTSTAKQVEISVADTGVGIPADKAGQVFNRFEKIGSVKKGFGLGLSVCQSIITLMSGKIWVDSTYTGGARFVFTLPLKEETV